MGITRQTVNRLLKKAELAGVVEFKIHNPLEALPDLSEKLKKKFNLTHALVVPCKFRERDMVTNIISQFAAQHIASMVEDGAENIGLSWGRTVYHSILNLPISYCSDTTFFPLVGASSQTAEYFMINEIVRRAASTMNAKAVYTYIPADPGGTWAIAVAPTNGLIGSRSITQNCFSYDRDHRIAVVSAPVSCVNLDWFLL